MTRGGILNEDCFSAMLCSASRDCVRSRHARPHLIVATSDEDEVALELLHGYAGGLQRLFVRHVAAALIVGGKRRHLLDRHPSAVERDEWHWLPLPRPLASPRIVVVLMLPLPNDIRWGKRDHGVDSRIPDCREERSLRAIRETEYADPVTDGCKETDRTNEGLDRHLTWHARLSVASEPANRQRRCTRAS